MEQQIPRPFAHLDAPLSGIYRRVMRVFVENKRRFVVHLRPEDVAEAVRRDGGSGLSQEAIDRAAVAAPVATPLICTEGVPSAACNRLLRTVADSGARIRWRGDFDWTGLRITATALDRYAAEPWRMSAADYETALAAGDSEPLRGTPGSSPWDPGLAARMRQTGRAVMEERLIPLLLEDLAAQDTTS
jgi:uncharacterized protein (TIGR02679 family)